MRAARRRDPQNRLSADRRKNADSEHPGIALAEKLRAGEAVSLAGNFAGFKDEAPVGIREPQTRISGSLEPETPEMADRVLPQASAG